jgi:hypothetical protein
VNIGTADAPVHAFMGYDDFYIFDGSRPMSIGTPVKGTVFASLNRDYQYMTTAVHDRINSIIYWFYPTSSSVHPDKCVAYNYVSNRWGRADRSIQATCEYLPSGSTYSDVGSSYSNYGSLPELSYGEAFESAGIPSPAIFDSANTLKTLDGNTVNSSVSTTWFGDDDRYTLITRFTPRFSASPDSGTGFTYYRYELGDTPPLSAGNNPFVTSTLTDGRLDLMSEARWHSVRLELVGNWEMLGYTPHVAEAIADE